MVAKQMRTGGRLLYTYSKHVQPPNSKGQRWTKCQKSSKKNLQAQSVHSKTGSGCFFVNCLISFYFVPSIFSPVCVSVNLSTLL
jgi:hypothetical protein